MYIFIRNTVIANMSHFERLKVSEYYSLYNKNDNIKLLSYKLLMNQYENYSMLQCLNLIFVIYKYKKESFL